MEIDEIDEDEIGAPSTSSAWQERLQRKRQNAVDGDDTTASQQGQSQCSAKAVAASSDPDGGGCARGPTRKTGGKKAGYMEDGQYVAGPSATNDAALELEPKQRWCVCAPLRVNDQEEIEAVKNM